MSPTNKHFSLTCSCIGRAKQPYNLQVFLMIWTLVAYNKSRQLANY